MNHLFNQIQLYEYILLHLDVDQLGSISKYEH